MEASEGVLYCFVFYVAEYVLMSVYLMSVLFSEGFHPLFLAGFNEPSVSFLFG